MGQQIDFKIDKKTVVHAKTEDDAIKLCYFLDRLGAAWRTGASYMESNGWSFTKEDTCYDVHKGSYDTIQFYNLRSYKIITVEEFLKLHEQKESKEPKYRILKFQGFTSIFQSDLKEQYDEWISENDYDVQNIEFSMDRNGDVRYFHAWVTYYE